MFEALGWPSYKHRSFCQYIIDTQYMALNGELWGVYFEYFVENELHYNGTAWYFVYERMFLLIHQKYYFVIREKNSCKQ